MEVSGTWQPPPLQVDGGGAVGEGVEMDDDTEPDEDAEIDEDAETDESVVTGTRTPQTNSQRWMGFEGIDPTLPADGRGCRAR